MPRKNCNARRIYKPPESEISPLPYGYDGRVKTRSVSHYKTTGESIVREFRNSQESKCNPTIKPQSTFQPYRVLPQPQPNFFKIFFNRINWPRLIDIVFAGLAILAIATITGIILFGPAPTKEVLR